METTEADEAKDDSSSSSSTDISISTSESTESARDKENNDKRKRGTWCRKHGDCGHSTEDCEYIKKMLGKDYQHLPDNSRKRPKHMQELQTMIHDTLSDFKKEFQQEAFATAYKILQKADKKRARGATSNKEINSFENQTFRDTNTDSDSD